VKMPSLSRKLGTIEEQGQNQSCLFRRKEYRKEGQNREK
jgi:hypothetical protein